MAELPSIRQMANRAHSDHLLALSRLAESRQIYDDCSPSLADLRGMTTVLQTLRRWGCIELADGGTRSTLTDRGHALLTQLRQRNQP